ncbi:hypothetical protein PR202_gb25981 [Eleusine coracana subsp. coracana]|uniref:Morc S5 domain-containing protein n=1 Tax=Eleusine coracana subsp. coracana TaxID=191504 RepID=A0AAV5FRF5_ELECO|nr:hypothetical protein PR202_gb25981 [Eleusine coracana subsp. coracana]
MNPRVVKTEAAEEGTPLRPPRPAGGGGAGAGVSAVASAVIDLSSSDSDSDGEGGAGSGKRQLAAGGCGSSGKRARVSAVASAAVEDVPPGFLEPIPPPPPARCATKQFWKAGDYDGKPLGVGALQPSALAELLDNSLDEVVNGATYVSVDVLADTKDKSRMLLVEDDGGGMDPDKMRQCMSLGYSVKSKIASTIGQYGNGFKTSTMRLGADVLVFSRSRGKTGKRATQSIGMLSYTFLRSTGKEDIIVPMIDFEYKQGWERIVRTTMDDWNTSLQTICTWSPYSTEAELLEQFCSMKEQGTRIIIYNLWEDDQGELELDFDDDIHSYASILYLRLPSYFQMILRGKEIDHHNIVTDMMLKKEVTYRPVAPNGVPKDSNMVAVVTIGFVKDAKHHIDVQGFNVYHKNRLIKPFWRVWTAAGSGGRGVIGVLEANFIEPAHDKQDFERTTLLQRLETRLVQMQKDYWSSNSHRIGYVGTRPGKDSEADDTETSPDVTVSAEPSSYHSRKGFWNSKSGKASVASSLQQRAEKLARVKQSTKSVLHGISDSDNSDSEYRGTPSSRSRSRSHTLKMNRKSFNSGSIHLTSSPSNGLNKRDTARTNSLLLDPNATSNGDLQTIDEYETVIKQLKDENLSLKERLSMVEESMSQELVMERDKNKSLTERVEDLQRQLESANKEQEALIDVFSEERNRRDQEEDNLRKKLKDASSTITDLLEQLNAARKGHKV